MKYPKFEEVFYSFCRKNFLYDEECVFLDSIRNKINPTRENIDRLILISAGFSDEDRNRYLCGDLSTLTKDLLSNLRKGKLMRDYIINVYSDDDALAVTSSHFKKYVPRVINDGDREMLLSTMYAALDIHKASYMELKKTASDEMFFDVLAALLIYAITDQDKAFVAVISEVSTNNTLVISVLDHLRENGAPNTFVNETIDMIFNNYWENIRYMFSLLPYHKSNDKANLEIKKHIVTHKDLFELTKGLLPNFHVFDKTRQIELYCLTNVAYFNRFEVLCYLRKYYEILIIIYELDALNKAVEIAIKQKFIMMGYLYGPNYKASSTGNVIPDAKNNTVDAPNKFHLDTNEITNNPDPSDSHAKIGEMLKSRSANVNVSHLITHCYEGVIRKMIQVDDYVRFFNIATGLIDKIFNVASPAQYIEQLPNRKLYLDEDIARLRKDLDDIENSKEWKDLMSANTAEEIIQKTQDLMRREVELLLEKEEKDDKK